MFDGLLKFFDIASIFAWPLPAITLLDKTAHGDFDLSGTQTFYIPYDQASSMGWSSDNIKAMLDYYGIQTWGGLFNYGCYQVCVSGEMAGDAAWALNQYGIPWSDGTWGGQ